MVDLAQIRRSVRLNKNDLQASLLYVVARRQGKIDFPLSTRWHWPIFSTKQML